MNYLTRKRKAVYRIRPAIRDGSAPPRGGEVVVCDTCRWPFPRPSSTCGGFKPVCGDCRRDEAERLAGMMAILGAVRAVIFPDHHGRTREFLGHPPGHAERMERYAARAALELPLFEEGEPCRD